MQTVDNSMRYLVTVTLILYRVESPVLTFDDSTCLYGIWEFPGDYPATPRKNSVSTKHPNYQMLFLSFLFLEQTNFVHTSGGLNRPSANIVPSNFPGQNYCFLTKSGIRASEHRYAIQNNKTEVFPDPFLELHRRG